MIQFDAKGEYSIYYKNNWIPLSTNKLMLSNGQSAFKIDEITKIPKLKSNKSSNQLDLFYEQMNAYVKFVENIPVEEITFKSLGFDKNNVHLTDGYCIGIAPKSSIESVLVYLTVYDRKSKLFAKFSYITKDEASYFAELGDLKEMIDTFKMNSTIKENISLPNISTSRFSIWGSFRGKRTYA